MRVLFTVCGRAGSKGIKGKNFREFLGYPLMCYTLSAIDLYCNRHPWIKADIALNTDSDEMVSVMKHTGLAVCHIARKESLRGDYVAKIDVIADTLRDMQRMSSEPYDMVVDCDITAPLRTVADIEHLVEKHSEGIWDVVFSVTEARKNPYFNMVKVAEDGQAELVVPSRFTARQQAPRLYDMNASLYAFKPNFLAIGKGLFEGKCSVIYMLDTAILDLDYENDFELMQVVAKYLFQKKEFGEIRQHIGDFWNVSTHG